MGAVSGVFYISFFLPSRDEHSKPTAESCEPCMPKPHVWLKRVSSHCYVFSFPDFIYLLLTIARGLDCTLGKIGVVNNYCMDGSDNNKLHPFDSRVCSNRSSLTIS